jgi:hypothetical protein
MGENVPAIFAEWSELAGLDWVTDPNYSKWGNSDHRRGAFGIFADTFFYNTSFFGDSFVNR